MGELITLLKENKLAAKERWYPGRLDNFKSLISKGCLSKIGDEVCRNVGYSLQYLEFLELQIQELVVSEVLQKMMWKTYIVSSVAIIEALLEEILRYNNCITKKQYEKVGDTIHSNEFKDKETGKMKKIQTIILEKLDVETEEQMKLDAMIKKITSKNKLLNLKHDEISALRKLQELRNKIHLSNVDKGKTNWHEFSKEDYIVTKFLMYSILTDDFLENKSFQQYIGFLKPSEEEYEQLQRFARAQGGTS